uniref:Calcitonin receptor-like n=1 Tax=Saccoglossus kowalevskii TaxID=10224 RepID=A0ABM0MFM2_SACKO|nr:PREDICTED: calcitonin receptor-like [Saccoglossus kowalevskii]
MLMSGAAGYHTIQVFCLPLSMALSSKSFKSRSFFAGIPYRCPDTAFADQEMDARISPRVVLFVICLAQIVGLCDGGENDSYVFEYYDNPWSQGFWFGDTFVELTEKQQAQLAHERELCVERMMTDPFPTDGGLYCNRTFDGWGCWNDTKAGHTAFINCPYFIPNSVPTRLAHRVCMPDGTWFIHPETNNTWSNYTNCGTTESEVRFVYAAGQAALVKVLIWIGVRGDLMPSHLQILEANDMRYTSLQQESHETCFSNGRRELAKGKPLGGLIVWYTGYSISIVSLTVSLVIFFYFKNLSCPRITLHKNLFFSFIFNCICWTLWFAIVAEHPYILESDNEGTQVSCKILNVMMQYFWTSNYYWMLCEGIYLHTLIVVAVFSDRNRLIWYYLLGWVVPFIPVTIYTILRAVEGHGECWFFGTDYEFIIAGPIIAVLVINFVLLLNIVRVLVTKLRATHTPDTHNYKKAVRATLILLPLLGLHYIIMPFQPAKTGMAKQIYDLIIAILIAFQGFFVACIFCFFNGEIRAQIARKYRSYKYVRRGSDFRTRARSLYYTTTTEVIQTQGDSPEQNRKHVPDDSPSARTKLKNEKRNGFQRDSNANSKNSLLREEYCRRNSDNNDVSTSLV